MFTAILAFVGAIVGVVGGVIQGGNAKFLQKSAEYEAAIKFQRDKETALYGIYSSQQTTRTIIMVIGIILLIALTYILVNKNK